ncbi:MAG: PqqD family protein [Verrucomicrobiota bacterium]
MNAAFRINQPKVIHENIDGEVVVINLDSGTYYSLTDSAARIWDWLQAGDDTTQIAARLGHEYAVESSIAHTEATRFLQELQSENLIVFANGRQDAVATPASGKPANGSARAFQPPRLQKFTDMQELLLLDPIHEVDEAGWPRMKNES